MAGSPSMQETLSALEGDELVFQKAKAKAQKTGKPQQFSINGETFQTRYDGETNITSPVLPTIKPQPQV